MDLDKNYDSSAQIAPIIEPRLKRLSLSSGQLAVGVANKVLSWFSSHRVELLVYEVFKGIN